MLFAKRTFYGAGIYGLVVLLPLYFTESMVGQQYPPAVTHAEYYYGFVGVAVAWQFLFFVIGSDPVRYRKAMLPAIVEKVTYGVAAWVLHFQGRIPPVALAGGCIDLLLMTLFIVSFLKTPRA